MSDSTKYLALKQSFELEDDEIFNIFDSFKKELRRGLAENDATFKCLPTFITKVPTGQERGTFLVADLGGSNLRVGCVELIGNGQFNFHRSKWALSDEVRRGDGRTLFGFIANKIREYLETTGNEELKASLSGKEIALGFTFSYPVRQGSLAHGILVQWNKGMSCEGVVGEDIVQLLHQSLATIRLDNIKVRALLNDTVATLAAHTYKDPRTKLGIILGTGTNAAVYVPRGALPKLPKNLSFDKMAINIEWGAFGDNNNSDIPLTEYDILVDQESINPGRQRYEKMISGMYLGELARLAIMDKVAIRDKCPFSLDTRCLSQFEMLPRHGVSSLISEVFDMAQSTSEEIERILGLSRSVVLRSAHLCAIGLAAVVSELYDCTMELVVAIDGSLYDNYPRYPEMMREMVDKLLPGNRIIINLAKSESLLGAAIVLACEVGKD